MFRLALITTVAIGSTSSYALTANFDAFSEGTAGQEITSGGIRFHHPIHNQGGSYPGIFVVDACTSGALGTTFSSPNILTFNGHIPGPGVLLGSIGEFSFTANVEARTAALDLYAEQLSTENTITLVGYLGPLPVRSVNFVIPAGFAKIHHRMDLASGAYDSFRLLSTSDNTDPDAFIGIDNVTISTMTIGAVLKGSFPIGPRP